MDIASRAMDTGTLQTSKSRLHIPTATHHSRGGLEWLPSNRKLPARQLRRNNFENGTPPFNQPIYHSTWTTLPPRSLGTVGGLETRKGEHGCQMHPLHLSLYITPLLDLIYPNIYSNPSPPIPQTQSPCLTPTKLNPTTTSSKLNVITKPSLVTSSPIFNPCPPPINPNPSHYPYLLTVTTCAPTIRLQPLTGTRSPSPP